MIRQIEQDLLKEFRDRGVVRGNMLLLNQENAIEYVQCCFSLQAPILGIDSFEMVGDSIRTDDYIDYSASTFRLSAPDVWKEAEAFLRRHSKSGLLFEIVIDEPNAPKQGAANE
jgi:hypothetical protein